MSMSSVYSGGNIGSRSDGNKFVGVSFQDEIISYLFTWENTIRL